MRNSSGRFKLKKKLTVKRISQNKLQIVIYLFYNQMKIIVKIVFKENQVLSKIIEIQFE
jgi:mRNA-degrading endonuclease HigB of HigAB toxin-antitoxin module